MSPESSVAPDPNAPDPDAWGVVRRYQDINQVWHEAPQATVGAILEAMQAGTEKPAAAVEGPSAPVVVVHPGQSVPGLTGPWQIRTESGDTVEGVGALPADLSLGYHDLTTDVRAGVRLIVAPPACRSTDGMHVWGWATQLYALRSKKSWGIGDLGDLTEFGATVGRDGAGLVLVNPLHAALVGHPQQSSPYFASSRRFRNPLYIRIEDVPGAQAVPVELDKLAKQGRALNNDRLIDRDAVWNCKIEALALIWENGSQPKEFVEYLAQQGPSLIDYATFCVLSEQQGRPWHHWPVEYRRPDSQAVHQFAQANQDRVQFYAWLQWLIDKQLDEAAQSIMIMEDLAIGADRAGADAWLWQDCMAFDIRVGCPPDELNSQGQNWGLPPFDPWRLREAQYDPFIQIISSSLRHAGALRIDHVIGTFRLYWIPESANSADGTYVRYPWQDLLSIVALESYRSGAYVVGEDLGTVLPEHRAELMKRNILSYRPLWLEDDHPSKYPAQALAAVTTHDLPTVAGLWSGTDFDRQVELGMVPNEQSAKAIRDRVKDWTRLPDEATVRQVAKACHELMAQAPSAMITASIEDALGLHERPNYPGTLDENPNWSVALPLSIEQIAAQPGYGDTVEAFSTLKDHAGKTPKAIKAPSGPKGSGTPKVKN